MIWDLDCHLNLLTRGKLQLLYLPLRLALGTDDGHVEATLPWGRYFIGSRSNKLQLLVPDGVRRSDISGGRLR